MYCNHCSVFTTKDHLKSENHINNKNMVEDILLSVVGGEKGLVDKVLSYKKDLEAETLKVCLSRLSFMERFSKLKEMTLTNTFSNELEIQFSPSNSKTKYNCTIELDEPITLETLTKHQKEILETFDLGFSRFIRKGERTSERMEEILKKIIKEWNLIHLEIDSEKLHFKEYQNINFNKHQEDVPTLTLPQ